MKVLQNKYIEWLRAICDRGAEGYKPPAFQFYPDDWLGSPTVAAMTPTQEGAYIHLLALCAASPRLALPSDQSKLAMMSRLNEDWDVAGNDILAQFSVHPVDGPAWLTNAKLIKVRYISMVRADSGGKRISKDVAKREQNASKTPAISSPPSLLVSSSPSLLVSSTAGKESRALAALAYDLILRNHPNLPTFKKDKDRVLESWTKSIERFLKRTGKQADEVERFFKWLAQDRQEKRPGSDWVGWWQPFQGVSVLDKDSAWAAFAKGQSSGTREYVPRELRGQA